MFVRNTSESSCDHVMHSCVRHDRQPGAHHRTAPRLSCAPAHTKIMSGLKLASAGRILSRHARRHSLQRRIGVGELPSAMHAKGCRCGRQTGSSTNAQQRRQGQRNKTQPQSKRRLHRDLRSTVTETSEAATHAGLEPQPGMPTSMTRGPSRVGVSPPAAAEGQRAGDRGW